MRLSKREFKFDGWQGYLCGPPPMVDAAGECLTRNGISKMKYSMINSQMQTIPDHQYLPYFSIKFFTKLYN